MKKLIVIAAALIFNASCSVDNNGFGGMPDNASAADKIRKGKVEIEIVVIDSCEYLFTSFLPWESTFSLTHKGNCKNH